jgi:hypothetical protein
MGFKLRTDNKKWKENCSFSNCTAVEQASLILASCLAGPLTNPHHDDAGDTMLETDCRPGDT